MIKGELDEAKQKVEENDPFTTFQNTEIVIGNFRFERPNPDADWTIVEMAQVEECLFFYLRNVSPLSLFVYISSHFFYRITVVAFFRRPSVTRAA